MTAKATGKSRTSGMNKTECDYARHLELLQRAGELRSFAFEPWKLRLADRTFYTPDFVVVLPNGEIECHEVKGFMRDDAAVKLKVAAELHPFRFVLAKRVRGQWITKVV